MITTTDMAKSWFSAAIVKPKTLQELKKEDGYDLENGGDNAITTHTLNLGAGDDKDWYVVTQDKVIEPTIEPAPRVHTTKQERRRMSKMPKKDENKEKPKKQEKPKETMNKAREVQIAGSHLMAIFAETKGDFFEGQVSLQ